MQSSSHEHEQVKNASIFLSFMILTFFAGLGGAFFNPILSSFLANEVKVEPLAIGFFYTLNALVGIVVSQLLARYSDRRGHRKTLILCGLTIAAANCLLFLWCRSYFVLASLGILLLSIGASASPQMFALAREFKDQAGERSIMFTSAMRSQLSLAWVVGPAIAFSVVTGFGFTTLFAIAMSVYLISMLIAWIKLPDIKPSHTTSATPYNIPNNNRDAIKLFIACTLMWSCNNMYIMSMPLYIDHELHLPPQLAGWMMGTAAALEIPLMLMAGYLTRFWRMQSLLLFSCAAGFAFYVGMQLTQNPHLLLVLQLGNAAFIGILGGLGMVYFQDLMPDKAGQATTLFTNSIYTGSVVAGATAGIVAQYWDYSATFIVACLFIIIAAVMLRQVRPL